MNNLIDLANDQEVPLTDRASIGHWGQAEFEALTLVHNIN